MANKDKKELEKLKENKTVESKRFETLQMSVSEDIQKEREDLKYLKEEADKNAQQVEKLTDEVFLLTNQNQQIQGDLQDRNSKIIQ